MDEFKHFKIQMKNMYKGRFLFMHVLTNRGKDTNITVFLKQEK
jgi:hypothetical protein